MTEEKPEEKKENDTMLHVAEAAGIISTIVSVASFVFPAVRIYSFGAAAVTSVLKYFSREKKK